MNQCPVLPSIQQHLRVLNGRLCEKRLANTPLSGKEWVQCSASLSSVNGQKWFISQGGQTRLALPITDLFHHAYAENINILRISHQNQEKKFFRQYTWGTFAVICTTPLGTWKNLFISPMPIHSPSRNFPRGGLSTSLQFLVPMFPLLIFNP